MPPTETQVKRELKKDVGPWIVISEKYKQTAMAFVVRDIAPAQSIANNYIERNAETTVTIIPVSQALVAGEMVEAFN